jgi:hypothetical protein
VVDQPRSPARKRERPKGTLSLPPIDEGMNKLARNNRAIPDKAGSGTKPAEAPKVEDKTKKAKHEEVLERARKRIERVIAGDSNNRKAMVEDRKFKAGEQWPADISQQRATEKRPCLTINRMPTFVHQVTNASRENRPSIVVRPVGSKADKEAAKIFRGMIRAVEKESHADIAYDTGFDDAVTSGLGWLRLRTEWRREDSFDQVAVIDRVRNPFTVYLDPDAKQPDGSDARWGCVTDIYPEEEFKERWPEAQIVPYDVGGIGERYKSWMSKDGIRVAEYYEVVNDPAKLVSLSTGYVGWEDEMGDVLKRRVEDGSVEILDERESHKRSIKCYHLSAIEILEEYEWLGKWVPLIPVLGEEIDIEGKVTLSGIGHHPQRQGRPADAELLADVVHRADRAGAEGQVPLGGGPGRGLGEGVEDPQHQPASSHPLQAHRPRRPSASAAAAYPGGRSARRGGPGQPGRRSGHDGDHGHPVRLDAAGAHVRRVRKGAAEAQGHLRRGKLPLPRQPQTRHGVSGQAAG